MIALIVENEDFAANNLIYLLKDIAPEIKVIGICKTAKTAIISIIKNKPELVFLDIELDDESNGIDMLKELNSIDFKIIFTTSFNEYALSAFRINAIDYLIKPYNEVDLAQAIQKMQVIKIGEQASKLNILSEKNDLESNQINAVGLRNQKGNIEMFNISDIEYLEADGSHVFVYLKDGKRICNTTASLTDFENILKKKGFIRIHHKYLINEKEIRLLKKADKITNNLEMGAGGQIILKSDIKLPVSRNYVVEIKKNILLL